jgi:sulfite reductase beta subunit-like hemoprotein
MGRRAKPLEDTPAMDILSELLSFVDAEQTIPNENAFLSIMRQHGYTLTDKEYRYYFLRLRLEGHISIEPKTRAVKVLSRKIVEVP